MLIYHPQKTPKLRSGFDPSHGTNDAPCASDGGSATKKMSTIFFLHDPADPKEGTTIKKWGLVILGRTKKIDKTSMGDEDLGMDGWR